LAEASHWYVGVVASAPQCRRPVSVVVGVELVRPDNRDDTEAPQVALGAFDERGQELFFGVLELEPGELIGAVRLAQRPRLDALLHLRAVEHAASEVERNDAGLQWHGLARPPRVLGRVAER